MAAGAVLALSTPLWGSYLGRRIPWFEVERVEVAGARLLAPHVLLEVSGIRAGQNILDDSAPWEAALRSHPVVTDVRITRRPPATLRIRVQEKQPIALVGDDVLALATAAGEILPIDPTSARVDLPIVRGSLDDPKQAASVRRVLAETARLGRSDPRVLADVSEIGLVSREEEMLHLIHPVGDILLPFGATESRLAELRAVLADLSRRQPLDAGSTRPVRRPTLDLRFEGQVVVRYPLPRERS